MADLYSLMHREAGPLATFRTPAEAEAELEAVLEDEPTWVDDCGSSRSSSSSPAKGGSAASY